MEPEEAKRRLRDNARQFGDTARGYAMSRTHNEGGTRHLLIERLQPVMDETLLDVACGAGGMTLAAAPYVREAIGLDPAPEMLHALRLGARRGEVANVLAVLGDGDPTWWIASSAERVLLSPLVCLLVASAASSELPPENTASRRNKRCSPGSSSA